VTLSFILSVNGRSLDSIDSSHACIYTSTSQQWYQHVCFWACWRNSENRPIHSSCLSAHPSTWNRWATTRRTSIRIDIWVLLENLSRKLNLHWNLTRAKGTLVEGLDVFMVISHRILLTIEVFQAEVVEKIKTHVLFSAILFLKILAIKWDNLEKYGRVEQATDNNMAHALCTLGT